MLKAKLQDVIEQYVWEMSKTQSISPRTEKTLKDLLDKVSMLEEVVSTDVECMKVMEKENARERYTCDLCHKEVFLINKGRHEVSKTHIKQLAIKLGQFDLLRNKVVGLKPPLKLKQRIFDENPDSDS
jgi:hypothetical protein